tara:strand:+ start:662 stop:916 length:255 start_codon:yes stop_codon:yes gene_type:complete
MGKKRKGKKKRGGRRYSATRKHIYSGHWKTHTPKITLSSRKSKSRSKSKTRTRSRRRRRRRYKKKLKIFGGGFYGLGHSLMTFF